MRPAWSTVSSRTPRAAQRNSLKEKQTKLYIYVYVCMCIHTQSISFIHITQSALPSAPEGRQNTERVSSSFRCWIWSLERTVILLRSFRESRTRICISYLLHWHLYLLVIYLFHTIFLRTYVPSLSLRKKSSSLPHQIPCARRHCGAHLHSWTLDVEAGGSRIQDQPGLHDALSQK